VYAGVYFWSHHQWPSYFCNMQQPGPIGVFDSGYGGLTVLKEMVTKLPQYDIWEIMPGHLTETGLLKRFIIIHCNV
jgi:hypothetical protein